MAIIAGIDEAGFGPSLGPLVISAVAFRVPDERADRCLWEALRSSCTKSITKSKRRLPIADSKLLFKARATLTPLERAALVMLAVSGAQPNTLRELLRRIAPDALEAMNAYPWYGATDFPLPTCDDVGDIATRANAIRRNASESGVALIDVACEPLFEGHYNRLVHNTRNKSIVVLGIVLRLIDRIQRISPTERVCLYIDRLGGRTHYREALMTAMPGYEMQVVEESSERSTYRLVQAPRTCQIEFRVEGEKHHFTTALASIYSKYVRELFMKLFNDYWCAQEKSLRPTAGYFTDAKRWLGDADSLLNRLQIDRRLLVRDR